MSNSPNLQLPYLDANQNQKTVTHNAALTILDALVNCQVQSAVLTAPPASPADGQCWIVASGGTGAWTGKDLNIAAWQDGAWNFYAPNKGFVAYVDAIGGALMWSGTAWTSLLGAITQLAVNALAIGTTVDSGNPLSAKLNSALFSALPTTASPAGTGNMRLTLSKQAAGNTASFLFQDNYSGRAEIGLAGDDNFHFKVSPDGATWLDALDIAAATGAASFLASPTAPTPATSDSSGKLATTAYVQAQGFCLGGRNLLVNGNFRVNQRGYASGAALAANAYGHDRWKNNGSAGAFTFTQASQADLQASHTIDTVVTIPAGATYDQVIEAASIDAGNYTLSWQGTATGQIYYHNGSAYVSLGAAGASPQTVTLAAGVTVLVRMAGGTVDRIQFERGTAATAFERESYETTFRKCLRYYQSIGKRSLLNYAAAATSVGALVDFPHLVPMRVTPTVTFVSPNYANASGMAVNSVDNLTVEIIVAATAAGVVYAYAGMTLSAEF